MLAAGVVAQAMSTTAAVTAANGHGNWQVTYDPTHNNVMFGSIHGQTHLISINEGIAGVSVLAPWTNFTFAAAALLLLPDTKRARPTYRLESTNVLPYSRPYCPGSNAPTVAVESLQLWPVGSIPLQDLGGKDDVGAT